MTRAETPAPADPPSLVALVQEWRESRQAEIDAAHVLDKFYGQHEANAERRAAHERAVIACVRHRAAAQALLAWTPAVPVDTPEPFPVADMTTLCVCGHTADEHGNDGVGHCGATTACRAGGCKCFRAAPPLAAPVDTPPRVTCDRCGSWTVGVKQDGDACFNKCGGSYRAALTATPAPPQPIVDTPPRVTRP